MLLRVILECKDKATVCLMYWGMERCLYAVGLWFVKASVFFPETSSKMSMVSEFLKQAWFIENEEQEYVVSQVTTK